MFSTTSKSKAASIWSFDSGYGSAALEEDEGFQINQPGSSSTHGTLGPFRQEREHQNLGDSLNLEVTDGDRLKAITNSTEPQEIGLDVFTAKVCSSNDTLFTTPNNDLNCLRCQLWNITNPGGKLRCEDCTSEALVRSEAIIRIDEQQETTAAVSPLGRIEKTPSKSLSQPKQTARCSACEISALINPYLLTNCTSYTPNAGITSPYTAKQPSKIKRSCARRPPTKLESHATRCLQEWLKNNRNNPYPDLGTKKLLAEKCGITEKQVSTWFTNTRARRMVVDASSSNQASEDEGSQKARSLSMTSTRISNQSSIDCRVSVASYYSAEGPSQTRTVTSRRGKKKDYGQSSNNPNPAHPALPVLPKLIFSSVNSANSDLQTWQCTFCYQHIARKSWRRHEETQHRPKRKWTCLLTGPSVTLPLHSDSLRSCVFCMVASPDDQHFARCHRIAECTSKSEEERTFLRPDHLRQHVKNFHKAKLDETIRDLWRREGPGNNAVENWFCGFCTKVLRTWDDRETHLIGHFKDGLTMADWKGYPGQDAETETSKKRPTSSEGRPNVLAKLARTLTGRSMYQEHYDESHSQTVAVSNLTLTPPETSGLELPLLPELVFDDFMPGAGDDHFDFDDTTFLSACEHVDSAEHHDSAFPGGNHAGLSFGSSAVGTSSEDLSFGLWYQ